MGQDSALRSLLRYVAKVRGTHCGYLKLAGIANVLDEETMDFNLPHLPHLFHVSHKLISSGTDVRIIWEEVRSSDILMFSQNTNSEGRESKFGYEPPLVFCIS
jgi:hypothetical protein